MRWEGSGIDEVGINVENEKIIVKINPKFFRPAEVEILIGNPEKAEKILGWERQISFDELVARMFHNDMQIVEKEIARK